MEIDEVIEAPSGGTIPALVEEMCLPKDPKINELESEVGHELSSAVTDEKADEKPKNVLESDETTAMDVSELIVSDLPSSSSEPLQPENQNDLQPVTIASITPEDVDQTTSSVVSEDNGKLEPQLGPDNAQKVKESEEKPQNHF